MPDSLADLYWSQAYDMATWIEGSDGKPLGDKARGMVTELRKAGMTAQEAKGVISSAKKCTGNPRAFVRGCIRRWRAEKGLT